MEPQSQSCRCLGLYGGRKTAAFSAMTLLLALAIAPETSATKFVPTSNLHNPFQSKKALKLPISSSLSPSSSLAFVTPSKRHSSTHDSVMSIRGGGGGGGGDNTMELVGQAYEWATNLGAPSALVAGAVIATLYENMASGSLDIESTDSKWVQVAKKTTRLLLVVAFILQIVCIFCTTVLGTHLLSRPAILTSSAKTAMEYLRENYEFEYLTSRISFQQGLITWLGAIALEHAIPQGPHESEERRRMDVLIASSLITLVIAMLSFYNGHMNFYTNYFDMLCRYAKVVWLRFVWRWPPRVMTVVGMPPLATAIIYFFKVFFDFPINDKKTKMQ